MLAVTSCGEPRRHDELLVLAAASLAEVLPPLASAFEAQQGVTVRFSFASSMSLRQQIEQGAPADVFVSASARLMDALETTGRLDPGTRQDVARNRIVAVTRIDQELPLDWVELARAGRRIGLGDEGVPVGEYARASLRSLGLWEIVEPRVAPLANEPAVLQAVMRAAVDWGVVYESSATRGRVRIVAQLPESSHPPITYPAAVLTGSSHRDLARAFIGFLVSPAARARLQEAGFSAPSGD